MSSFFFRSVSGNRAKVASKNRSSRRSTRSPRIETLEPRLALSGNPLFAAVQRANVGAGSSVALSPVADASVNGNNPYANYGNTADLLVQNDSRSYTSDDAESYLKFNLGSVNGTVAKAVLTLTPLAVGRSAANLTVGVQLLSDVDDSWVEGSGGTNTADTGPTTWYNSPYGTGQYVTFAGSQCVAGQPLAIDVTSLVNQGINANGIASFILGAVSNYGRNQAVDFASRENAKIAYRPTLTITTSGPAVPAPTVAKAAAASNLTGNTVQLAVLGSDGGTDSSLVYSWSASGPAGAALPTFSASGTNAAKNATATFHQAGTYTFTATITNPTDGLSVTSSVNVTLGQTLTGIQVSPPSVTVAVGGTQQFSAVGIDQFGQAIGGTVSGATWSMTGAGSINASSGLYTAPATLNATSATVTVHSGSLTANSAVTLSSSFMGIKDATLSSLTQSLDADGSINRTDLIAILRTAETLNGGVLSSGLMADLRTLLADAAALKIPGYVQVLAGDIINGNTANAHYLGQSLGNLTVGSSGSQLDKLVGKWFLGADHPATGGYVYSTVSGPLFSAGTPTHNDEIQGYLGDCYLISSLGTIGDTAPSAIQNMIVDNGVDAKSGVHTWTVRFYNNGRADYVTVDDKLPTSGGRLIFDGYGAGTTNPPGLWIALIEKAYAQWNETGNEGRDGTNTYSAIEGGWMADVDAQVLGHDAASYSLSSNSDLQALINGMNAKNAVTIGTMGVSSLPYGLYGSHAYAVIGYNAANQTFTLYNPWGSNQPTSALTWAQLQATCDGFVVANATGTQSYFASMVIAPPPGSSGSSAAGASTATTTSATTSDSGGSETASSTEAVDAVMASQVSGDSTNTTTVSDVAEQSDAMSALRTFGKLRAAVDSTSAARHGAISAKLRMVAIDRVFETI